MMALRSVAGLPLGYASRCLLGGLSSCTEGLHTSLSQAASDKDDKHQQQGQLKPAQPSFLASHFLAHKDERQAPVQRQQQQQRSPLGLAAAQSLPVSALLPARSTSVVRRSPLAARGLMLKGLTAAAGATSLQQARHYNAYNTVQRYFVEGQYVIDAEANRAFQFTGLDSNSFYPYLLFGGIATAISVVFMVLPLLIAPARVDLDKSSAYECGFDAFGEARQTFSVSFYLVSIMYLLFDIELVYLFPYAMTHANGFEFFMMNLFLSLLVVGFVYEWGVGALEWRE